MSRNRHSFVPYNRSNSTAPPRSLRITNPRFPVIRLIRIKRHLVVLVSRGKAQVVKLDTRSIRIGCPQNEML